MNQRLISETKKYVGVALFLFLFFEGFATYRRLILAQYQIDYFEFGYSLIEAMILAKVILLGDMLHIGERFRERPLIVPTLYKTFTFSLFVLAFNLAEHFVSGFVHGMNVEQIIHEIEQTGAAVFLARVVVMFIAFIPMFSIWELGEVTADGRLFELFFLHRAPRHLSAQPTENATVLTH
ncbi:MAG TPA: hypothetical protein VMA09_07925 [Candidatus Binataceae bacterium]|nr:hypothetical protein [Candidatus Binataceae bacterium]